MPAADGDVIAEDIAVGVSVVLAHRLLRRADTFAAAATHHEATATDMALRSTQPTTPPEADDMTSPDQTTTMQRPEDVVPHLLAAMVRVLSGRPSKAEPADLTITAVAVESGLKRHYLTHKHPELKDLFYQLRDHHQNPVKHDAAQLKWEIDDLKRRLRDANDQRRRWKTTAETFARAFQVLTLEKCQLQQSLHSGASATISLLPNRHHDQGGETR